MDGSIRIKIKRAGDATDAGKWFAVVRGGDFQVFLAEAAKKLSLNGASKAADSDGTEFDDTSTFREGDVIFISGKSSVDSPKPQSKPSGESSSSSHTRKDSEKAPSLGTAHRASVATLSAASSLLTAQRREAPGPAPRLIIGNLLDLLPSAVPACRRLYKQYGGIVKLHLFGKSVFVITEPDYLQPVLDLPNKRLPAQELAGNGLFLSDGPTWKLARSTLSPYFTVKYINEFVPLFAERARHLIQEAEKLPATQPIDIMDAMTKLAFESICSAGFNYDVNMLDKGLLSDEEPPFISAFQYAFEKQKTRMFRLQFFNKFPTISNIKFWNSLERLNKSVDEIIDTHCPMTGATGPNPHTPKKTTTAATAAGSPPDKKDLLSLMLDAQNPETGEKLSRENIREQCITLLVAGHKTTTLLSGWFVYCLSQHPEVEQKLVEELYSIFGTDASRPPTVEELKHMRYLDQCLRETLRLYPPAQSNLRGCDEELMIDGYHIPANSNFMVNVWDVHRHPKYWTNPDDFDPERFTPENMEKMHPYQWIPFGGGPRTCIGMPFALTETKVALSMMLRKFSFQMAPGEKVVVGPNPLKPLTGVKMVWNRRSWTEVSQKLGGGKSSAKTDAATTTTSTTTSSSNSSGSDAKKGKRKPIVEDIPEDQWATLFKGKPVPVTILYGSNQGASKSYAQTLASELEVNNFLPEVFTCDDFDVSAVSKLPVLVVISSTYNGLAPENAEKFCAWLGKKDLSKDLLESTRFAVFGCGNKQWHTTFQRIPRMMQKRLAELGGEAMLDLVEGDESGDMETQYMAWKTQLITVLCDEFQRVPATLSSASKAAQLPAFKPHYTVKFVNPEPTSDAKSHGPVFHEKQYKKFKVSVNRELQSADSERSTRHIELKIPHYKAETSYYVAGDHLAVYPEQPEALVEAFAKRIKLDLDAHFVVQSASLKSSIRPPAWSRKPVSVRQYLAQVCDLSAAPTRKQLEVFASLAKDPVEAERLRELSNTFEDSVKLYEETVIKVSLTIVDALNTIAKSVDLSFAAAIEILSATKPRFYSISSSPVVHADRVHITVGVKEWDTASGQTRRGLCSSYLASLKPGDRVYATIKACPSFRLPKEISTPMICIGAGTGVAPFRGFLQERAQLHESGSVNVLIFGCRNDDDYIYKEEWKALQDSGKARIETAFSRATAEGTSKSSKEYVQDRLKRIGADVFSLIDSQNGSVFVCGDGRFMAKDVSKALHDIAMKHGGMTELEAQTFVTELQTSGRYLQDVWG